MIQEKRFILCVDDNHSILGLYKEFLGNFSNAYECKSTGEIDHALGIVEKHAHLIDILILDGDLGVGDSGMCWNVLPRLRKTGFQGKAIIITGNVQNIKENAPTAFASHVDILSKPVSMDYLTGCVENYLCLRGGAIKEEASKEE